VSEPPRLLLQLRLRSLKTRRHEMESDGHSLVGLTHYQDAVFSMLVIDFLAMIGVPLDGYVDEDHKLMFRSVSVGN
jgi:hypothetical protein